MTDVVDRKTRSRMMSGIRGKNTRPELLIRRALFGEGFRYRIHDKRLPGRPDLVFPKYGAVIFVHGCFWHRHDCHLFKWPAIRMQFWRTKLEGNVRNDQKNLRLLKESRYRVLAIWECALKGKAKQDLEKVVFRVAKWLRHGKRNLEIRGE